MRADVDLLELLCETPPPPEVCDGVGILYVRGPIDHHKNPLGVGCSYEQTIEWFHCLNDDPQVNAILFCIDSPGGLVSGLNATVRALRKAKSKPVYAIADEMMTSAAYAISCVADEILATPSAVVGSVGVISTMCSQARADKAMGLDFVTITSGARKADGHPHMPIEDAAVAVESERVDSLAGQFFALVDESRDLSPDYLRALEAGIFLGGEAEELGLVDEVIDVEEAIKKIASAHLAQNGTISLAQPKGSGSGGVTPPEASMLSAKAQIANLTRKMAASTSKKERAALASQVTKLLAALPRAGTYKKTYEKETEESSDEEEDEEEEGGNETDREEESDEDEKKASKHMEEEESAESEDDEKKAESDDKDDHEPPEKKESKKASAKIAALEAEVAELRKRDAARERNDAATARKNTIDAALRSKRITPAEAKTLATKDGEYIAAFLEARPKAVVLSPEEALRPLPSGAGAIGRAEGGAPEAQVALSAEQEKMLADVSDPKLREAIVKNWAARNAARETA